MRIGAARASWARDFAADSYHLIADDDLLERARVLATEDRVRMLVVSEQGETIIATIRPLTSRGVENIRVSYDGQTLSSHCSCDGANRADEPCVHALAAIIAAAEDDSPAAAQSSDTQQDSSRAVGRSRKRAQIPTPEGASAPARGPEPVNALPADAPTSRVGLEFSLTPDDHVEVRPVRRTGENKWIASGNSWEAFTDPAGVRWATTDQSDAIFDLYQVFLLARRQVYAYGSRRVQLDTLGPRIWPALAAARDAGVVFVPGFGLGTKTIALLDDAYAPAVDIREREDGLDISVLLQPPTGAATLPPPAGRLLPLGAPMHGALVVGQGGAKLVRLPRPSIVDVTRLAAAGRRRIPLAGKTAFFARELPRLALHVDVVSSDDSAALPEATRPRLSASAQSIAGARPTVALTFALVDHSARELDIDVPAAPLSAFFSDDDVTAELGGHLLRALRAAAPAALGRLLPTAEDRTEDGTWRRRIVGADDVRLAAGELLAWLGDQRDIDLGEIAIAVPDEQASTPHVAISAATAPPGAAAPTAGAAAPTGASGWLDLDVDVTVAGERVPFEALFSALAAGAEKLHLASGRWIDLAHPSLDPLRTLIESARSLHTRTETGRGELSVSSYDVAAAEALDAIGDIDDAKTRNWVDRLRSLTALASGDAPEAAAVPATVNAELRDYQQRGVAWANHLWTSGLGGVLADDMGLGKTLQLLTTIAIAKADGRLPRPALVVAPTSVVGGWVEQAARFTPDLSVVPITRSAAAAGHDLADLAAGADILVTSYAIARIDADELAALGFSALIIDEAQFVKNPSSKTFRALRDIPSDVVIAVTGTPLENSLTDLWAMFALTAPGLLGTLKQFQRRFKKPIENADATAAADASSADAATEPDSSDRRAQLRRLIAPFLLRRTKRDVASELPEKQDQILAIELTSAHRRRYDEQLQIERQRVLGLLEDADKNRVAILRSLTILRRLALDVRLGPRDAEPEDGAAQRPPTLATSEHPSAASAKTATLIRNLLEISAEGHRALVFSQFTTYLALVRQELEAAGIEYCYLDGATRRRADVIERFRTGDVPVFLISLKAGGFGLNLTEADYVFLMDPWWNPAVEEQAVDRTHRIGQTRPVNVYRLVAADTIEEKVLALQERKRRLFDDVIGDGSDFGAGALTPEDVRGLLAD